MQARVPHLCIGPTIGAIAGAGAFLVAVGTSCKPSSATARATPPALLDADAAPPSGSFCSLPGSVVSTPQGPRLVAGADSGAPDLGWLALPVGFCVHFFATVKSVRQLRFAPDGVLFAASPTRPTTGGAGNGVAGIVVLPDDDHDGAADSNITFLQGLSAVQGLMFANGFLYYQDDTVVRRVAFKPGDRQPSAASETITDMSAWPQDGTHWPKVFDIAKDGTIYVSNGGSQGDVCKSTEAVRGGIFKVNADGSTSVVARGFRNPIALRCEPNIDVCLAAELALDYSWNVGREKIVPIREGDDWGYPCCATRSTPYQGAVYADTHGTPDCSAVSSETASFVIGHTPFGLDFETGQWPSPWTDRAFVTLHGDYGTWSGARLVALALDPQSGLPLPSSELSGAGTDPANMLELASGWDDGNRDHGRPAALAFAPDGRLFIGNDWDGAVIWIAPVGLMSH